MTDFLSSPVWDNVAKEITQPWGPTTLTIEPWWPAKNCHWHCGVDIGLVTGTPLKAARAGQAKIISYGLLVISVSPTQADYYVHIDRAFVSPGQWVKQGQLVAYSGAKVPAGGFLTGPHLHFEVQTGGLNVPATSLDPIPVLGGDEMIPEDQWHALAYGEEMKDGVVLKDAAGKPVPTPVVATLLKANAEQTAAIVAAIKAAGAGSATNLMPILNAIADLKAHPGVQADPILVAKIDALSKHLGIGSA